MQRKPEWSELPVLSATLMFNDLVFGLVKDHQEIVHVGLQVCIRAAVMIWAILVNTHTHTHTRTQTASMLQMSYRKDTLNGYLLLQFNWLLLAIAVISIHHIGLCGSSHGRRGDYRQNCRQL